MVLRRFMRLVTPRLMVLMAALVTILVTAALGQWQLRRADEKSQAQAVLAERRQLPALTSKDFPCGDKAADALPIHRSVELTGVWWHERTIWLDNRTQSGRSGFEVVTPLRLHAPGTDCDGRLVLIQRGWAQRHPQDRMRLPTLPLVAGIVTVPGRLVTSVSRVYQVGEETMPSAEGAVSAVIRQNADERFWKAWLGQTPLPGAVLQTQATLGEDVSVLRREWAAPDLGRDKHMGYATQWFALSLLATCLTIWFQWIRPHRINARRLDQSDQHVSS